MEIVPRDANAVRRARIATLQRLFRIFGDERRRIALDFNDEERKLPISLATSGNLEGRTVSIHPRLVQASGPSGRCADLFHLAVRVVNYRCACAHQTLRERARQIAHVLTTRASQLQTADESA
jgi:hypothetical protein